MKTIYARLTIYHLAFSIIIMLLLYVALTPAHVFATGFSISPAINTVFTSHLPITKQITLTNLSHQIEHLQTQVVPIKQDANANAVLLPPSFGDKQTQQILSSTRLQGENITLLPEETMHLLIHIGTESSTLINHDYYFSITFISKDNDQIRSSGQQTKATIKQEIAIAALFLISANHTSGNSVLTTLLMPMFSLSTTISPTLIVQNRNSSLSELTIHYMINGLFGNNYVNQYISKEYVLSQSKRSVSLPSYSLPFPFIGPAFVRVSIKDTHSGERLQLNKEVFILPIRQLVLLSIFISCIILIIARVKRKLNK